MNMELILVAAGVTASVATGGTALLLISKQFFGRSARQRLQEATVEAHVSDDIEPAIVRDTTSNLQWLVAKTPSLRRLEALRAQADVSVQLGQLVGLMLLLGAVVGLVSWNLSRFWWMGPIGFAVGAGLPVFVLVQKKKRRVAAFERQFPDALDILTSALRAGLAFSGAIQVVSEESPEPVSKEFTIVFEEHRLGLDMKEALRKLAGRIDCAELRMFVTAVILQRETGGNLAEILDGTAAIIRDRFRILGEVRAMTAQQRFSGLILSLLPIGVAGLFTVTAPDYMVTLFTDPMGRYIVGAALVLQLLGFLIIRKIVDIKV